MSETTVAPHEVLTLDEIYDRFKSEWVLLEDPELGEHLEIVRGRIVCHSKDRDEVYTKMLELRPKSPATLYTGRLAKGEAILL